VVTVVVTVIVVVVIVVVVVVVIELQIVVLLIKTSAQVTVAIDNNIHVLSNIRPIIHGSEHLVLYPPRSFLQTKSIILIQS
jgi:hypothetical protein